MFELAPHGPDTYVGQGPRYPWGGLYGGQIVAQALRAARSTVDESFEAHSIRAYFIRRGDHTEPVRYEVDRIRNGRTFVTRRVVARQAVGAILNAECSFQLPEPAADVQTVTMPNVPAPDELESSSWAASFSRCFVPDHAAPPPAPTAGQAPAGRVLAWMKVDAEIGDAADRGHRSLHQSWLAFLSDDLPTDSVRSSHPVARHESEHFFGTSLDHTIWFHRPMRADRWHLHDFSCHHFVGARGLSIGHVFDLEGLHVATIAQEVLLRDRRAQR
ncbi:acyl-CoA thioesterase II [soil metagenome]